MKPGDKVLLRDEPLLRPLIVDHVRNWFAGEPEPNGPVFCQREDDLRGFLARYDQCELVPVPPGYEPPPNDWTERLAWLARNREQLVALHGSDTIARAELWVSNRIQLDKRITDALTREPASDAMRRAEIALLLPITAAEVAAATEGEET